MTMTPEQVTVMQNKLPLFTGTEAYHRHSPFTTLTDGAQYLAETAGCYWLYDIFMSVCMEVAPKVDGFATLKLKQTEDGGAEVYVEDGNGNEVYYQKVEYTDFPLDEYTLFCQYGGGEFGWVIMLPTEY